MKTLLLVLSLFTFCGLSNAQDFGKSNSKSFDLQAEALPKTEEKSLREEVIGTFQVKVKENQKVLITEELLLFVKSNRQQSVSTWHTYSSDVEVFIPSSDEINSPSFSKLDLYNN